MASSEFDTPALGSDLAGLFHPTGLHLALQAFCCLVAGLPHPEGAPSSLNNPCVHLMGRVGSGSH